jgi:hypothetical protein
MGYAERIRKEGILKMAGNDSYGAQVVVKITKMRTEVIQQGRALEPIRKAIVFHTVEGAGEGPTAKAALARALGEIQIAMDDDAIGITPESLIKEAIALEQQEEKEKAEEEGARLKLVEARKELSVGDISED